MGGDRRRHLGAGPGPATRTSGAASVAWVQADLTTWAPQRPFDLVVTCYAHPTIGQHAFYRRIAGWVAPGGTLFIVGHHHQPAHGHTDHGHPATAVTTAEQIAALLERDVWTVQTASEMDRAVADPHRHVRPLRDVVVRARRG
jgi:trans-aconitate methyltransferase